MIIFKGIRKLLVLYCLLTLFPILPAEAAFAVTGEAEAIDGEVVIREYGASAKTTFPLSGGIEYRLTFSFCAFGEGETVDEAARAQFDSYFEKLDQKEVTTTDLQRNHVHAGILTRFEYQKTHGTVPTTIHVIRFGDIVFASNPFELFLDYGNRIRARSYAAQTFLIQLAAGNANGYLPTERAEKGGHYSAYVSSGLVGHEGGTLLVEKTIDEINNMF